METDSLEIKMIEFKKTRKPIPIYAKTPLSLACTLLELQPPSSMNIQVEEFQGIWIPITNNTRCKIKLGRAIEIEGALDTKGEKPAIGILKSVIRVYDNQIGHKDWVIIQRLMEVSASFGTTLLKPVLSATQAFPINLDGYKFFKPKMSSKLKKISIAWNNCKWK